jgi:hypothetical protein
LAFIADKSGLPDGIAISTYFDYFCKKYACMDTLIVHLDKSADKAKLKSALELIRGIASVSDKITRSDFEEMADDILINEMKKAEKGPLLSYEDGKKEFSRIKKRLIK